MAPAQRKHVLHKFARELQGDSRTLPCIIYSFLLHSTGECECAEGYRGETCHAGNFDKMFVDLQCDGDLPPHVEQICTFHTTTGMCPNYRLANKFLCREACKSVVGLPCQEEVRLHFCEKFVKCPAVCSSISKWYCAETLQEREEIESLGLDAAEE